MMDQSTAKLVSSIVKKSFAHLSRPQKKNLADLIMAFFHNPSFALWEIASCLSGETTTKHKHKRLIYFLDQFSIDLDFWKSFVLTVFSLPGFRFKSRKYLTLAIDATTLKDDFWILAVSVSFHGRSIPIYVRSWAGVNTPYNYWKRVETVLTELKQILPQGWHYELVADRGFQGETMLAILKKLDWDYVVRLNGCWRMKNKDGREYVQLDLFADGFYEQVYLGKKAQMGPVNVAINSLSSEDGGQSKWYLMTNRHRRDHAVNSYTRRFWIEETFKDLKSKLKWEGYTDKVPHKDRLTKCIVVSCLSYAIQTSIGSQIQLSPSEEKKTSVFNRFRQAYRRNSQKLEQIIIKFLGMIATYIRRTKIAFGLA